MGKNDEEFSRKIQSREKQKIRGRETKKEEVWFGLGMFGMVGWAVAIPTVLFTFLGIWLDRVWPQPFSWTLTLLLAGMVIGCFNAWFWIKRERGHIEQERRNEE